MEKADENRLLNLLSMARKAGKLLMGFDAVKEALLKQRVQSVVLAADCSAKTEKEIRFFAGEVPVKRLPTDMNALYGLFTKKIAVFGVCDAGFAAALLQALPSEK